LESDFQKELFEACSSPDGIGYDSGIFHQLLTLLAAEPPFKIITVKIVSSLLMHLTYNKKMGRSLKNNGSDLNKLIEVYKLSIDRIINFMKKANNVQIIEVVPDLLEDEWTKFKFGEQQEIEQII